MTYQDRDGEPRGRVIVGIDTTLSGLHALRLAVGEARMRGAVLHAVRTWGPELPDQLGQPGGGDPGPGLIRQPPAMPAAMGHCAPAAAAAAIIDRAFADTMGGEPTDLPVRALLLPDAPGPALVEHACRDHDLLVIGAGRRRFPFRPRGSPVVRYCLRRATCPVLVVPPPPLARAGSPRALLRELRRELDHLPDNTDR